MSHEDFMAIVPKWAMGKKDGWEKLVDMWTGKDLNFAAKSIQNSNNRGHEGTHSQGNRDFYRYMDSQVAGNERQEIGEAEVWKMAHKKKVVAQGEDPYYGTTSDDLAEYTTRYKELNGQDSDPLKEPVDERAVVLAGQGRKHGRYRTFNTVIEPTTTLTYVKTITGSHVSMPPRARPTHAVDHEMQTAWQEAQDAWMQQVQDHSTAMYEAQQAHQFAYMTALTTAMRNGTAIPDPIPPPPPPPYPPRPCYAYFVALYTQETPATSSSRARAPFGRASASPTATP